MISLLCSGGSRELQKALNLSREMARRGIERNVHTFSALMNVCIKAGQYQTALDVYKDDMQASGCQPNVVTYNTLIDLYGKTGQWREAMHVMDKMRSEVRSLITRVPWMHYLLTGGRHGLDESLMQLR